MRAKLHSHLPTIILIGGSYTTNEGDQVDSRQPFADDPHSSIPLKALSVSELWWATTSSLVLPLLKAKGPDAVAKIGGPRTVISPNANANGPVSRRRLASILPGGVRTAKKSTGRWRLADMSELWTDDQGAAVVVDTWGWYWFNAMSASDYAHFEKTWLTHDDLMIVAPHTCAATSFLDGYVRWVSDGRHEHILVDSLPPYNWDISQVPIVPVEADFHVTGILQDGAWVDPAPVEAARALLQARFDLQIGLWDLATNDTLRATLLRETEVSAAPETAAARPASVVEREQRITSARSPEQIERDNRWEAAAEDLTTLDAFGWTAELPDRHGHVDPAAKYTRSLLLASVPDLDPTDNRPRHPALRPGRPILWLHCNFQPAVEHSVVLIVPPPISDKLGYELGMFFVDRQPALRDVSAPYRAGTAQGGGQRGIRFYELVRFGGPDPTGWPDRIRFITRNTQAWEELLQPVTEMCLASINTDPSGIVARPHLTIVDDLS